MSYQKSKKKNVFTETKLNVGNGVSVTENLFLNNLFWH